MDLVHDQFHRFVTPEIRRLRPKYWRQSLFAVCELGWQPSRDLATQIDDTLRWRRKMAR